MLKSHFITAFCFLLSYSAWAQDHNPDKCALNYLQERILEQNPDYAHELAAFNKEIAQYSTQTSRSNAVLTIPVVVHVIHTGEAIGSGANLTDARIRSQIDVLNRDYRRLNTDAGNTPSEFSSMVADTEIEFCMASKDPNGNPTNGIVRKQYGSVPSIDFIEDAVKPNTRWNGLKYMNIWVLEMPDDGILGYSYLPTNTILGSALDGIVISYKKFGDVSFQNSGRTTTHEVGHYLGLQHIWGSSESCGNDDNVSDTPNSSGAYYGCPSSTRVSCSSSDMYMNYMDYVDDHCMNAFTQGQANVMRGILSGSRSNLVANASVVCDLVANEEVIAPLGVEIFPNPSSDILSINVNKAKQTSNLQLTLVDQLGKVIYEDVKADWIGQYNLDVSSFSNGLYFLNIQTADYQGTHKVLIVN